MSMDSCIVGSLFKDFMIKSIGSAVQIVPISMLFMSSTLFGKLKVLFSREKPRKNSAVPKQIIKATYVEFRVLEYILLLNIAIAYSTVPIIITIISFFSGLLAKTKYNPSTNVVISINMRIEIFPVAINLANKEMHTNMIP